MGRTSAERIQYCSIVIRESTQPQQLERAYLNRGNAYMKINNFLGAVDDFSAVIRINPKIAGYYDDRQTALRLLGRYEEALDDANKAIRIAPSEAFVFRSRAYLYDAMERYDAAIADYTKSIALDRKGDIGLRIDRGKLLAKIGRDAEAVADFTQALAIDGNSAVAFHERGRLRYQLGDFEAALEDYDQATRLSPDDVEMKRDRDIARQALAKRAAPVSAPPIDARPAADVDVGVRVALVIGNSAYKFAPVLPNPQRDATAVGAMFRAAGFRQVIVETNLDVVSMRRSLRAFADKAADADIAIVYFAGHGVEIGGRNYLVPVDAALSTDLDARDEAIELDRVLELLDPARRLKLVLLDACRDNPFASRMRRAGASRAVSRGLAPPDVQGSNTLVAYAARAGAAAEDGEAQDSPFAKALLHNLTTPGLDVRIALGRVHDEVMRDTGSRQEPFIYGALGGDTLALAPQAR